MCHGHCKIEGGDRGPSRLRIKKRSWSRQHILLLDPESAPDGGSAVRSLRLADRERETEDASLLGGLVDPDLAAMCVDDALRDVESQPESVSGDVRPLATCLLYTSDAAD